MFESPLFSRRNFLQTSACGFGYLAFSALAAQAAEQDRAIEAAAHYESPLTPKSSHFPAKAKRVIFLFMQGGPSHVDTFDYKPELQANDGKSVGNRKMLGSPFKFHQHGNSGQWMSDVFPNLAKHADDMCIINSMHTDTPAHPQATIAMHTGTSRFVRPSMGSWVVYGLGSPNKNLPGFITINPQGGGGGAQNYGSAFLPAAFEGTRIDGANAGSIPNIANRFLTPQQQRRQVDLIQAMNRDTLKHAGQNAQIEGVIESYELGFRMQSAVPDVMDISKESDTVLRNYGISGGGRGSGFGRQCLLARRFAESGVRFIEVGLGGWDQHQQLQQKITENAQAIDQPIAALLSDLKQRGLLDETLVVWGGEFGRTPSAQGRDGRDHNNRGFSMWMAGGGVKGGLRYGATDEFGQKAVTNKVHIHDLHATILALLGLDHEKLTYRYAGRDFRLTEVYGEVARGIMA